MRVLHTDQIDESVLCRRLYRCEACGHETLTVGSPLPDDHCCFMWVADQTCDACPPVKRICRGSLTRVWMRDGVDIRGLVQA